MPTIFQSEISFPTPLVLRAEIALFWIIIFTMFSSPVHADIIPSALFSDNMVLQRDVPIPVWGTASPGEKITVTFGGQNRTAVADAKGRWQVALAPLPATSDPQEMVISSSKIQVPPGKRVIRNILVGEVWLAGGQSNMEYPVNATANFKEEVAAANYPTIRFFHVKTEVKNEPTSTLSGSWVVCSPQTAGDFSGVGYYFARDLQKVIKVPVGVIQSAESGTLAEAWMSREALESDPVFRPILERYRKAVADHPQALETYRKALEASDAAANTSGSPTPAQGTPPVDPATLTTHPSGLFNGKIVPLSPYALRGVIWWQGEYNSERGEQYKKLFPALIRDWRSLWKNEELPFLFVQLGNYDIQPQPNSAHYDELRDAQLFTLKSVSRTGMVVACDVGDPNDIHPKNKQAVGARLALLARGMVYGEKELIYSGPIYRNFAIEGNSLRIQFDPVSSTLTAKDGKPLESFEIAGDDRKFVSAQAAIEEDSVVVSSPEVINPMAVRYAWRDNPTCSLYNAAGLPASPFRTDNWSVYSTGNN